MVDNFYKKIDEWVKQKKREWVDDYDYVGDHLLWDEVDDAVVHLMTEYGPDGHCDGHNLITGWILENYEIRPLEQGQ